MSAVRCSHGQYYRRIKGYPADPKTLGQALRRRRLDLHLRQTDVAGLLHCHKMSIVNWEQERTTPALRYMAGILQFLGYNPLEGSSIGERLVNYRRARGITQKALAHTLGVDPCTLSRWERGQREPKAEQLAILELFGPSRQGSWNPSL